MDDLLETPQFNVPKVALPQTETLPAQIHSQKSEKSQKDLDKDKKEAAGEDDENLFGSEEDDEMMDISGENNGD